MVKGIDKVQVQKALEQSGLAICLAFLWDTTPQGYDYWCDRADGHNPLTDDDRAFLQSLLEQEQ